MYEKELNRVRKKIFKLSRKGKFNIKKVYLFGEGINTRQIAKILNGLHVDIEAVIDNDISKQGGYCYGKPIISLLNIEDILSKENMFIVYSGYWREMMRQLKSRGVSDRNIILLYNKENSTIYHLIKAELGKQKYFQIKRKYGTDNMYLCPYTGTGDIYLIGSFWKEYCERNNIKDYAFIVITNACKKVAMLYEIEKIEVLKTQKLLFNIISAHMLWPDIVKLKILNDCWPQIHTNQIEWFRGYKGLEFMPMFRQYVFNLPNSSKPQHPRFKNCDTEIAEIMDNKGLKKGKTVILSPYSNTLLDLPDSFWEEMAKDLQGEGFCICTNCGDNTESEVNGTIPVFFPLTIAPQFIETAGYFIGIRSGFCDVISGAKAKKVILYEKRNRFYMGSAYEYFNLKDMLLCDDALEIEFTDIREVKDTIIKYIIGEKENDKEINSLD